MAFLHKRNNYSIDKNSIEVLDISQMNPIYTFLTYKLLTLFMITHMLYMVPWTNEFRIQFPLP